MHSNSSAVSRLGLVFILAILVQFEAWCLHQEQEKAQETEPRQRTGEPWNDMDYGPFLSAVIEVTPDNIASKGIAIPLDDSGRHAMVFDTAELRWAAAWTGDFVELKGIVYDGPHGVWPRIAGETAFTTPAGPGVAHGAGPPFEDPRAVPYGPLPAELGRWKGLVRDDDGVLLHYTIGNSRVYERPGGEQDGDLFAWTRSLEFHDVTEPFLITMLELEDGVTLSAADVSDLPDGGVPDQGTEYIFRKDGEPVLMVHAMGIETRMNPRRLGFAGSRVEVEDGRLMINVIPPLTARKDVKIPVEQALPGGAGQIRLLIAPVNETTLSAYRELAIRTNSTEPALLAAGWNAGSEALWPQRLTLEGDLEFDSGTSEDRQLIQHGPDADPEQLIRRVQPGQSARIVLDDGTPMKGLSGWLDDSVVLIDWKVNEEPRLLAGWDFEEGTTTARHPKPRQDLKLKDVEVGERALQFKGDGEAIWDDGGELEFLETPITVAAWIRTETDGTIFSQANAEGPWIPDGKTFFIRGGRLCYDVGWVGALCGETEVADGDWHHVAFTWNPRSERVTLWVDGEEQASEQLAPRAALPDSVVRFGFTAENFPAQPWFEGSIGGIRLIKRELFANELLAVASGTGGALVEALAIRGLEGEIRIDGDEIIVSPSPVESQISGELLEWFGSTDDLPGFYESLVRHRPAQPDAFIVDRLSWPNDNPWRSWMRFGDFDFLDEGRSAAISTWNGDVWRVDGIDGSLESLEWQRIASGLSQPLGLKTRGDEILVAGRDQVTRLVDLNGDRETDRYEAFNVDTMNAPHFHEPVSGMQVDADGNLYYMKGARHAKVASHPHHGTTIRMSADGSRSEVIASGFRAPNGLWVDPDGVVFGSDQEGHWTPANRINRVEPGGFYGNNWSGSRLNMEPRPDYDPPLCWIHPSVDRSPSAQVRVPPGTWGDLAGRLLGISYGTGEVYLILEDAVEGVHQGGIVPLDIKLPTGLMRARFNPADGDLYLAGLFGWSSNQTEPGGFYRVRRSSAVLPMPLGVRAVRDGMLVYFNDPIATPDEYLLDAFSVEAWNYEWTANYGSLQYDIDTGKAGTTGMLVEDVSISNDRRTVWLNIPRMKPAMQVQVDWSLEFENGGARDSFTHLTVHKLADVSGAFMLD
jgi:hypothetical protein